MVVTAEEAAVRRKQREDQLYLQAIPGITAAYKDDPRTGVADALLKQGLSTAPAVGGIGEGLSRVVSALAGAYVGNQQRDLYRGADTRTAAGINAANVNQPALPQQLAMPSSLTTPISGADQTPIPAQLPPAAAPPQAAVTPGLNIPPPSARLAGINTPFGGAPGPGIPGVAQALTGGPAAPPPAAIPQNPTLGQPAGSTIPTAGRGARPRVLTPGEPAGVDRRAAAQAGFGSYQSSAYDPLEQKYAAQYGVPVELLHSIRVNGEKSNANQVSPAGAATVYQITPGTRQGVIKNYGFDPYASPENSVRGAAAVLSEGWKASNGDPRETAARYIAGTAGVRGRQTKAYVNRVVGGMGGAGGGSGASTAPGSEIGPPPQFEVPPLPAPPTAPTDTPLPDRVQSTRLAVAQRLLQDPSLNPEMAYMASQPYLEKGYEEEAKAKENEYQAGVNRGYLHDQMAQSLYNEEQGALYKAPIEERNAIIGANVQGRLAGYTAENQLRIANENYANKLAVAATAAAAKEQAAHGKPVPQAEAKQMDDLATSQQSLDQLMKGFNDQYVGYGLNDIGNLANAAKHRLGDAGSVAQTQWWQQYNDWTQSMLKALHGARITQQEIDMFNKSHIDPSMNANSARQNMDRQLTIANTALARHASSARQSYNPAEVYQRMGGDVSANIMRNPSYISPFYQGVAKTHLGGGQQQSPLAAGAVASKVINGQTYYQDAQGHWFQ